MNKKIKTIHIFSFFLFVIAGCAKKDNKLLWHYFTMEKVNRLIEEKKYSEALALLEPKAQDINHEFLRYNYASLLLLNQKIDESKVILEQISGKYDALTLENTLFNRGNIAYFKKDFRSAVKYYQNVLLMNSENYNAKYNLELALLQEQKQSQEKQQKQEQSKKDESREQKNENQKKDQNQNQDQQKQNSLDEQKKQSSQKQNITPEKAQQILDALKREQGQLQKFGQKSSQKQQRQKNSNRSSDRDW